MNLEGNKRYQSVLEHFQISYFSDKKTKRRLSYDETTNLHAVHREVGAEIPNDNQKFPRTKTAFHESPDPKEDADEDDTEECWNDNDDEHYLLLLKHQESFLVTRCDQTSSSLGSAMKYDNQSSVQELTKRLSLFQSELTQVRERIEKLTRKSEDGSHYYEKRKTASEELSEYVFV